MNQLEMDVESQVGAQCSSLVGSACGHHEHGVEASLHCHRGSCPPAGAGDLSQCPRVEGQDSQGEYLRMETKGAQKVLNSR